MTSKLFSWLGVVGVALASGAASAHHSYTQYDRCKPTSIEGEIESIVWTNPHVLLNVRTTEAGAYRVEWWDLLRLERNGFPKGVLQAGDRVVITGSVNRDPTVKIITLLTEVRRPSDGWSWARPQGPPSTCAQTG
jgi:hypothetical protein